jgi:beta,beta-carotene 9',10'-dioxygenase
MLKGVGSRVAKEDPFALGFGESAEELVLDNLPVRGQLPEWLTGTLLRNGPGTFRVGEQRYRHWFDGLAMLHKFSFGHGRVAYANKFLRNNAYAEARKQGRIAYSEFATDPCRDLFGRVMSVFSPQITDSAKVSLARIADRFLALAETPIQVEFDPETLETAGVYQYEQNKVGQMTTVHPHFADGAAYNVVTRYNAISFYRLYKMAGRGAPQRVGQMPVRQPSYMHSFGMSPNYAILAEFPLVVNPISLLLWLKPYIENFQWKPQRGTPFHIMNRHTGEMVGRIDSDPFFAFHHVNAFEQGNELVVDIVAYPDDGVINAFYLHRLADPQSAIPFGELRRYRLPLHGRRAHAGYEVLSDACMELPRFDYDRFNMDGSYRYVYASSINPAQREGFYNQIVKADIQTGQDKTWYQPDCYPGEPVFVGAPGRTDEDDGVILSVVLDAAQGNSFLLVLDAASFGEIARAEIPHPVLFGYHGDYFHVIPSEGA